MELSVYLPTATRVVSDIIQDDEGGGLVKPRIEGKTFGVVFNSWKAMTALSDMIADRLMELGAKEVIKYAIPHGTGCEAAPGEFLDDIAANVDGAICGLGN
jgi:hypothetical protein